VRAETPKAKAKRIPRIILGIAVTVTWQVKRAKSLPVCKAVPIEGCVNYSVISNKPYSPQSESRMRWLAIVILGIWSSAF